jgi:hypothetical protein
VLLVAGGMYSIMAALEALGELVRRVACVLNGDRHWLDADTEAFAAVQRLALSLVLMHFVACRQARSFHRTDRRRDRPAARRQGAIAVSLGCGAAGAPERGKRERVAGRARAPALSARGTARHRPAASRSARAQPAERANDQPSGSSPRAA